VQVRNLSRIFIAVSVVVMVGTSGLTLFVLYDHTVDAERLHLAELVRSQARLIESLFGVEKTATAGAEDSVTLAATLSQLRAAHSGFASGEFTLARLDGNGIVFLLTRQRREGQPLPKLPMSGELAEPMRRALSAEVGAIIGLDHRGNTVVAAFEPVAIPGMTLGIVAKRDLAEIRGPFVQGAMGSLAGGVLLFLLGILIVGRVSSPMIKGFHENETLYKDFVEGTDDLVVRVDARGLVTYVNSKSMEVYGLPPLECRGLRAFDFVHPDDRAATAEAFAGWKRDRPLHTTLENRQVSRTGEIRHMRWSITPHYEKEGDGARWNIIGHDVTQQKATEDGLYFVTQRDWSTGSGDFLKSLALYLGWALHVEYAFIDELLANHETARTVGFSAAGELVPNIEYDLTGTPCGEVAKGRFRCYPQDVQSFFPRNEVLKEMGTEAYAGMPLWDTSGDFIGLVAVMDTKPFENVTLIEKMLQIVAARAAHELERMKSEEERQLLSTAIEHAAETVLVTDADGMIQYVNPMFEKLTGYSRSEVTGKSPRLLQSGRHDAAFYDDMWETLTAGGVWSGRLINRAKDGSIFEEEATISPVQDARGMITNFVAVKRDVTRERDLEAQLSHTEKMKTIGTLAGGISHDFNNLLQIMLGHLDMAREDTPPQSPARESLDGILTAVTRATDLVGQILSFSRRANPGRAPQLLQPLLRESLKLLRASLPATIEIRQSIDPHCGPVLTNTTEFGQIVLNLCTNAFHAMREEGGVLAVELAQVNVDPSFAAPIRGLEAGRKIRLLVRDTGAGMDASVVSRIFEPYFTTKKVGEGTGLGLATVHGIVEAIGGALDVQSELGMGTQIAIYFPMAGPAVEHERVGRSTDDGVAPPPTRWAERSERVLIVDDEAMVAATTTRGLRRLGYMVDSFTSSVEALDRFTSAPNRFDLVITDQTMPDMTGLEMSRAMLKIRPNMPIILFSGVSDLVDSPEAETIGVRACVMKPIRPSALATLARHVIDATHSAPHWNGDTRS
jgi:PAS domain S-box-containing protein